MRILWSIHLYPPKHNCGAEYVAHHVNKYLMSKGHEVRVMLLQHQGGMYHFEGVEVVPYSPTLDAYGWADVIITHLDYTRHTINMASMVKKPVIHFMHNDSAYAYHCIKDAVYKQYMVYNSNWLAKEYQQRGFVMDHVVLQPPCPVDYYRILGNPINSEYITLINLNENKGGYQFYRIAEALPNKKFMGVIGSYDDGGLQPHILQKLRSLPNVKIVDHSPNVREIYQQTRLLLVLSRYESWGRVATEAMSNGIPVIYCPTSGLLENVLEGGICINSRGPRLVDDKTGEITVHDGDTWKIQEAVEWIEFLDDPDMYATYSEAALERYKTLQNVQAKQLLQFEQLVQQTQQDYQRRMYAGGTPSNRAANVTGS
jgi:glycosyltransferase involved in cell wall biosynthesis